MVNTEIRLIIFFVAKDGEALHTQQKQDQGADCDSDHELLIAKFRLKLQKVGKTTRPFRYAEYIMRNAWLEKAQAGIKISMRNINNLRYADGRK